MMDSDALFENSVLDLSNKISYFIIKQTMYNGHLYLLGNELIDDETPSENVAILKADKQSDGTYNITYENDEEILKGIMPLFEELLNNIETVD